MRAAHRSTLLLLIAAAPVSAQSLLYDAGPAGTPPTTPSPGAQGWSATVSGQCAVGALSPDPTAPFNAWQIHDPGPGIVSYAKDIIWVGADFDVELVMLPLAGGITLEIDTGDLITNSLFELQLEIVGSDVHIQHGGMNPVVCAGAVDGQYHTWRFGGRDFTLSVEYDGMPVGTVDETAWGFQNWGQGLRFGTFGGTHGRARIHRAEMTLRDWGPEGTPYCGPAVPNSSGAAASITAEGDLPSMHWQARLRASGLPSGSFGFFLVGDTQGFSVQPGGSQGNLCLGGTTIGRYVGPGQILNSGAAGTMWLDIDPQNLPTSPPIGVMSGETWNFQAWFRDANPMPTSNFSDAVALTF